MVYSRLYLTFPLVFLFPLRILSCPYGDILGFSSSTTVDLGEKASFYCIGYGSYLYWFIDNVNLESISSTELENRGISTSGYFNHYPPYFSYCDIHDSTLYITGNCQNNKTEIQCMILGYEPPYNDTRPSSTLTVHGDPVVVNDFEVLSTTTNSITIWWNVTPIENSSLTLGITDSYGTVNDSINVTGAENVYNYIEIMSPDPCNVYTFKLTPQPLLAGCSNISVIYSALLLSSFPKPSNVSASYNFDDILLTVRFQIHHCFRGRIQLLLVGTNGTTTLSNLLYTENIHFSNQFYVVSWRVKLSMHSMYFLTVLALDAYRTSTSDVTRIYTYNVKDLLITRNGDDVCFTCVTIIDCYMSIEPLQTSPHPIKHNVSCYSFITNGTYIVYIHDIDDNGKVVLMPAIVEEYVVDWIIPSLPELSNTELPFSSTSSLIHFKDLMSMYSSYVDNNSSSAANVEIGVTEAKNDQSSTRYILGGIFALSGIILLILLIIIPMILFHRRKKVNTRPVDAPSDSKQCDPDGPVITTTNAAYEMIYIGGNEGQQASTSGNNDYSLAQSTNDAHIYDDPDIQGEFLPPAIPPRLYEDFTIS